MKYKQLQKRLIKAAIISLIALAISLGVFLFISDLSERKTQEIQTKQAEKAAKDTEYRSAENELVRGEEAIKYVEKYNISENMDSDKFSREFARSLLSGLRETTKLVSIEFSMESFAKADAKFSREMVSMYKSKVSVNFVANSDVAALNMIKNLITTFPGEVFILDYEVTKSVEINEEVIENLKQGKSDFNGFVTGKINFEWMSIRNNPEYEAKKKAQEAAANNGSAPNAEGISRPNNGRPPRSPVGGVTP